MYVVCHDGTNIKKEQQGTIYVSSTMQTAIIKDIKGIVCEWLDCILMNNGIAIGEPMSRSPYSNWIQAAWTFRIS